MKKSFASDNCAGVHPVILNALKEVNLHHAIAYGADKYTIQAKQVFYQIFGKNAGVFFVFNGTAANVLGIQAFVRSYSSVICANTAHINVDECGAVSKFCSIPLITVDSIDGKLSVEAIAPYVHGFGNIHHSQPRVISISQPTEMGTVYSVEEIKALADFAHKNNMILHMDGARIANAAVSLNLDFMEFTGNAGVDVLSFGGTKNGMMYGEAVIFFNEDITDFEFYRKQGMQLASKMRYISAQFIAYLSNDLWQQNASQANNMARMLLSNVVKNKKIEVTQHVDVNAIFAKIPAPSIKPLQDDYFFYVWNEQTSEVRWMCSWDTVEYDVMQFCQALKKVI